MHQRIPVTSRFAAEGFGGSKFTPMRSIGAPLVPGGMADLTVRPGGIQPGFSFPLAADNGGDGPAPSPSPSPSPSPAPTPDVIVRPTTFIVPPQYQYPPQEPVLLTEASPTDDTTKTLITVAAALGIFTLGAILF